MPDLPTLLAHIREKPGDEPRRLALASWLSRNGRYDEAAAVRVLWPTLRDNVVDDGVSVEAIFADVTGHARLLGQLARQVQPQERAGRAARPRNASA